MSGPKLQETVAGARFWGPMCCRRKTRRGLQLGLRLGDRVHCVGDSHALGTTAAALGTCVPWGPWPLHHGHVCPGDLSSCVGDTRALGTAAAASGCVPHAAQVRGDLLVPGVRACSQVTCCLCRGGKRAGMRMVRRPPSCPLRTAPQPLPTGWNPKSTERACEGSCGKAGPQFPCL